VKEYIFMHCGETVKDRTPTMVDIVSAIQRLELDGIIHHTVVKEVMIESIREFGSGAAKNQN
jgi:hypothetical protein